ncbi:MAG: hypothetical protein V2I56_18550 [Desulfobacteraceae bacterium]|jgi:hypothetical protein|nr:hypothetical protein [Desulfobacteraceae bacterium]
MADDEKTFRQDDDILPRTFSADLRGRQSVRATFKLSERAIEAMSIVAVHLGIKQKSLFDHLIEDAQSLDLIAREVESERFSTLNRVQKTYVISRKTLSCLDETSKRFNAPRDALVEYSIQRLMPVINRERERHRTRKEILRDMTELLENGLELLQKSRSLLGEEDPVSVRFESAMRSLESTQAHVKDFVEKGEIIEEF